MKIFLYSQTYYSKNIKFHINNNNFTIKNFGFYYIKKINKIFNNYYSINKIYYCKIKLKNKFFYW